MPKKILIVDDEKTICETLKRFLSIKGYEVFIAHSGEEALSKLYEVYPDLIILDVVMPGMNGYEVCKRIRKDSIYKKLPILMLTAKSSEEDRMKGFNSGADEYMVKPFSLKEFVAKIEILLKR